MITRSKARLLNHQKEQAENKQPDIIEEKPIVKEQPIIKNIPKIKVEEHQTIYDTSKNKSDIKTLLKNLKIDETLTTAPKKYKWDTVKDNTFPQEDWNFMTDLIQLPKTKLGNQYLLVCVDLWSNDFDIEEMKTKTASECLSAFRKILKRPYLDLPKGSIRTDGGGEFKGVFNDFLKEYKILHRVALPYRHKQMANVESLNGILGRIFMTYLTNKEQELGKPYLNWDDIVDTVRIELNKAKYKQPDGDPFSSKPIPYTQNEPEFQVGDIVSKKLEVPRDIFGKVEANQKWRKGDLRFSAYEKLKIIKVLNYPNNIRYILNGYPNVSYTANELKKVDVDEEYHIVRQIIDQKVYRGQTFYRVWWKRELKENSTWELADNLIQDGLQDYIHEYHERMRKRK
jgi:hypothetical protein